MRAAFDAMGGQPTGLVLRCTNGIPHGRGLGSSAAAVVSGILAARALLADGTDRLPGAEVLRLAVDLEGHPDNVAACLAGGLTVAWQPAAANNCAGGGAGVVPGAEVIRGDGTDGRAVSLHRFDVLAAITAVACVAPSAMATHEARAALPASVPHADAAANAARSALLLAALTSDPSVLFDATEDYLHQRYRAAAMPATADLLARLRRAGVAAVMSGAGPSVLALGLAGAPPGLADGRRGPADGRRGPADGRPGPAGGRRDFAAGGLGADGQPGLAIVDSIARETGIAWHVTPPHADLPGAT